MPQGCFPVLLITLRSFLILRGGTHSILPKRRNPEYSGFRTFFLPLGGVGGERRLVQTPNFYKNVISVDQSWIRAGHIQGDVFEPFSGSGMAIGGRHRAPNWPKLAEGAIRHL